MQFKRTFGGTSNQCSKKNQQPHLEPSKKNSGNAMHAVRTQCEVLDVGKYSHPSYLLVVKH